MTVHNPADVSLAVEICGRPYVRKAALEALTGAAAPDELPALLTLRQAAELTGRNAATVRRWVRASLSEAATEAVA